MFILLEIILNVWSYLEKKPQVFILIYLYFFTILYSQLLIIARLAVCLFLQC